MRHHSQQDYTWERPTGAPDASPPAGPTRSWVSKTWFLGRFWRVPVRLHWSLPAAIAALALFSLWRGESPIATIGIMSIAFFSVFLHEFGHVGAARTLGIGTQHVTMTAIGGVAALQRSPTFALHELWVTIAGPAVNALLAVFGFVITLFLEPNLANAGEVGTATDVRSFMVQFTGINLVLLGFNLLPILPMDGGRILRALLRPALGGPRATEWAVHIGRFVIVVGLIYLFASGQSLGLLPLTAFFIWTLQRGELGQAEKGKRLRGRSARDAATPLTPRMRYDQTMGLPVIPADTPLETLWWDLQGSRQGVTRFYLLENGWLIATITPTTIRKIEREAREAATPASSDASGEPGKSTA